MMPLSVGQRAMWFIHRMAPASAAYNVTLAVHIRSPLDLARLARAVDAVVARHDLLRSTIVEADGEPWRNVDGIGAGGSALDVADVGAISDDDLFALAEQRSREPFRLTERGRAFRVVVLRRGDDDAALIVNAHHIVADAPSLFLVLRDTLTAYRALGASVTPALAPLRLSYNDFVAMERKVLDSPRAARLAEYWRNACAGSTAARLIPDHPGATDATRPGHCGATWTMEFPPGFAADLGAACARSGHTAFAYLLGAFQAVLHRSTGQRDFLVGTPATTRFVPGLRDVAGYMVNSLPLRATFGPTTTLHDAVVLAGEQVRHGMAHAMYPYPLMAAGRGSAAGADRPPLVRTTVTMLSVNRMEPALPFSAPREIGYAGLRLSLMDVPQQECQFDLSVELRHSATSVGAAFRYNTNLFEPATIRALADRFGRLAALAVAQPHSRVADVPLVDDSELHRLLALGQGQGEGRLCG